MRQFGTPPPRHCEHRFSFSAASYTVDEGQTLTVTVTDHRLQVGEGFQMTCSSSSVDYATHDGTAGSPDDYGAASGTLSFPAGDADESQAFTVTAVGGETAEGDENMGVGLSNPS